MTKDAAIIEALGGTFAVAKLCKVKPTSVSAWKREGTGIPPARRMFLELVSPDVFKELKKRKAA